MLNTAFANESRSLLQIRRVGMRIFPWLLELHLYCSNNDRFWVLPFSAFSIASLITKSSPLLKEPKLTRPWKKLFQGLINTVKFSRNMTYTFGMCTMPMWIENILLKLVRTFLKKLYQSIRQISRVQSLVFNVPRNRIGIRVGNRNWNINRFW
jgi:hypothetical protein